MNDYIKLAWRNIWRNKRRTLITIASIFFAMFFALVMRSMQVGSYSHWINSLVQNYVGYIQIHQKGYWDNQSINNTFDYKEDLKKKVSGVEETKAIIPRLESFALASYGTRTKGAMVVGIDPDEEEKFTKPSDKLIKGNALTDNSQGVLITSGLANYLKIGINDTLVLLSQGYHGITAAGLFPVEGIIEFANPELNRRLIYINLPRCQEFYGAYGRLTSLVINLHDEDELAEAFSKLKEKLDLSQYEVMNWKELRPEMVQQIKSDQSSGYIMLGILYMIIGFGVFGTVLMMTTERRREFGVMIAIGMRKGKLALILSLEILMLGIVGIFTGLVGAFPLIRIMHEHPIRFSGQAAEAIEQYGIEPVMPFAVHGDFYMGQSLIVLVIFLVAVMYPIYSVTRIRAVKAISGRQ